MACTRYLMDHWSEFAPGLQAQILEEIEQRLTTGPREAGRRMQEYLTVRCPAGLPPIGSAVEREPLLMKRNMRNQVRPGSRG